MQSHCASLATQPAKQLFCSKKFKLFRINETSYVIHVKAQQNMLNMWHGKQEMQIQTEHQMIWFEQLYHQEDD